MLHNPAHFRICWNRKMSTVFLYWFDTFLETFKLFHKFTALKRIKIALILQNSTIPLHSEAPHSLHVGLYWQSQLGNRHAMYLNSLDGLRFWTDLLLSRLQAFPCQCDHLHVIHPRQLSSKLNQQWQVIGEDRNICDRLPQRAKWEAATPSESVFFKLLTRILTGQWFSNWVWDDLLNSKIRAANFIGSSLVNGEIWLKLGFLRIF